MSKFLQTKSHAASNYGLRRSVWLEDYPLLQFQFFIEFIMNSGIRLGHIIQGVDVGEPSWDVEKINKYNYRKLVYTKVNFNDTTITFHQPADGKVVDFWKQYYEYYSKDGTQQFDWGYNLERVGNDDNFIKRINIYEWQAQHAMKTVLINPKIVDLSGPSYNHTQTEVVTTTATLRPEWIEYEPHSGIPGGLIESQSNGALAGSSFGSTGGLINLSGSVNFNGGFGPDSGPFDSVSGFVGGQVSIGVDGVSANVAGSISSFTTGASLVSAQTSPPSNHLNNSQSTLNNIMGITSEVPSINTSTFNDNKDSFEFGD